MDKLRKQIVDFLSAHQVGLLSMAGPEGVWAMPVCYRNDRLQVECLLPRWADAAYYVEQDPRVLLVVLDYPPSSSLSGVGFSVGSPSPHRTSPLPPFPPTLRPCSGQALGGQGGGGTGDLPSDSPQHWGAGGADLEAEGPIPKNLPLSASSSPPPGGEVEGGRWLRYAGLAELNSATAWLETLAPVRPAHVAELYHVIRLTPQRIDLFDESQGWGARETLDL